MSHINSCTDLFTCSVVFKDRSSKRVINIDNNEQVYYLSAVE